MVAYIVTTATRTVTGREFVTHRPYGTYREADAAAAEQSAKAHAALPGDLPCPIEVPIDPNLPTRLTEWSRFAKGARVAVVHEVDGDAAAQVHAYLANCALVGALDAAHAAWVAAYLAAENDLDDPATVAARKRLTGLLLVWLDDNKDAATEVLALTWEHEDKSWRWAMNRTAEDTIEHLEEIGEDYPESREYWTGHRVPATPFEPSDETRRMSVILAHLTS